MFLKNHKKTAFFVYCNAHWYNYQDMILSISVNEDIIITVDSLRNIHIEFDINNIFKL